MNAFGWVRLGLCHVSYVWVWNARIPLWIFWNDWSNWCFMGCGQVIFLQPKLRNFFSVKIIIFFLMTCWLKSLVTLAIKQFTLNLKPNKFKNRLVNCFIIKNILRFSQNLSFKITSPQTSPKKLSASQKMYKNSFCLMLHLIFDAFQGSNLLIVITQKKRWTLKNAQQTTKVC